MIRSPGEHHHYQEGHSEGSKEQAQKIEELELKVSIQKLSIQVSGELIRDYKVEIASLEAKLIDRDDVICRLNA